MPITLSTPTGSPTMNFSVNTNSPVVGYDSGTTMPESGTAPNQFPNAVRAFSGQIRTSGVP